MDGPPDFVYQTKPATYNGTSYTDFYFICRIKYTQPYTNDRSTFEVALIADSLDSVLPHKIVHADNLEVIFNSSEASLAFDHTVSISTRQ